MEDIPQGESPALRLQLLAPGFLSHPSRGAEGMFLAIKLILPNSAGGHVTRRSEFEDKCCVHEVEDHWARFKLQT